MKKKLKFSDVYGLILKHRIHLKHSAGEMGHIFLIISALESKAKGMDHGSFVTHCYNERWDSATLVADGTNSKCIAFYRDIVKLLKGE